MVCLRNICINTLQKGAKMIMMMIMMMIVIIKIIQFFIINELRARIS
jgi:capsular polysaccharide biosynthesis protein